MSIRLSRKAIRLYNNIEFTLQQMSQRQSKERSAGIWARMAQMKIDTNTSATTYVPEFGNFFFRSFTSSGRFEVEEGNR